jgi:hypothetical protein
MIEVCSKNYVLQFRICNVKISGLSIVSELQLMLIMILKEKGNRLRCFFASGFFLCEQ